MLPVVPEAATTNEVLSEIVKQLHRIKMHGGGIIFDRYELQATRDVHVGGQGVVHYATGRFNPMSYAIKFFFSREVYQAELDMYSIPALQFVLPPADDFHSNDDGRWRDPSGRPLPPCMVMERGEPFHEWFAQATPTMPMAIAVMLHLMKAVSDLHAVGYAHRDLKPSNAVFLSSNNSWTLIDFGSAAVLGRSARMSISLAYAAPELAAAFELGKEKTIVTAPTDVWALGMIAHEVFVGTKVFADLSRDAVLRALTGKELLPWEDVDGPHYSTHMRRLGKMRKGVLAMLHRDPTERAHLDDVRREWNAIFVDATKSLF